LEDVIRRRSQMVTILNEVWRKIDPSVCPFDHQSGFAKVSANFIDSELIEQKQNESNDSC